jgi:hypothetical protein
MRLIAYYLPQYHTIPENDKWWGPGFTEWTNVRNAKPLFKGHYQPIVPGNLGYYNILDPSVREKQAELARNSGIEAFCYWHYWFGNGKQLLERPFKEVLKSGKPDFPFCLGWANESWKAKVWARDSFKKDRTLMDQLYPGEKDIEAHFYSVLEALHDQRYLRIEGKPLFVIYKPFLLPDSKKFIDKWNNLAIKEGFSSGIFFVGHSNVSLGMMKILELGFDAINIVRIGDCISDMSFLASNFMPVLKHKILDKPLKINYSSALKIFSKELDSSLSIFPSIIPNWDHTPRSENKGLVLHGSTPELFRKHILEVFDRVKNKPEERQIIFIKSWNEWGEGNFLEPDTRFGMKYLDQIKEVLAGVID